MKQWYLVLLTLALTTLAQGVQANTAMHFFGLNEFNAPEQRMLRSWLKVALAANQKTLGSYPFDVEVYLYHRRGDEPVPWANTWRDGSQQLHFYVDSRFSQQRFVSDWTAYHEFSHLALPYLGSQHRWFAEGFASFMQYQVMAAGNIIEDRPDKHYALQLAAHLHHYQSDRPPLTIIRSLFEQRRYKPAYWGSAWFFVSAERQLRQHYNTSLTKLIERYIRCCRLQDDNFADVIDSLDTLLGAPFFSELLKAFKNEPARAFFPQKL